MRGWPNMPTRTDANAIYAAQSSDPGMSIESKVAHTIPITQGNNADQPVTVAGDDIDGGTRTGKLCRSMHRL